MPTYISGNFVFMRGQAQLSYKGVFETPSHLQYIKFWFYKIGGFNVTRQNSQNKNHTKNTLHIYIYI
jgi:hypothetical protein